MWRIPNCPCLLHFGSQHRVMQGINVFWEGDSALHPTYSKHMDIRSLGMEQSSVKQTPPEPSLPCFLMQTEMGFPFPDPGDNLPHSSGFFENEIKNLAKPPYQNPCYTTKVLENDCQADWRVSYVEIFNAL